MSFEFWTSKASFPRKSTSHIAPLVKTDLAFSQFMRAGFTSTSWSCPNSIRPVSLIGMYLTWALPDEGHKACQRNQAEGLDRAVGQRFWPSLLGSSW